MIEEVDVEKRYMNYSMEEKKSVKTWNELLKEIKEYQNTLPENTEIWYRGQPDAEYTLLPSLLRYKNGGKKEKEIFDTYRRLS